MPSSLPSPLPSGDPPRDSLWLQPLFPLALGRVQLAPDPLETAGLVQEILALRGEAEGNPVVGCAWTGDLNGIWQLQRRPAFAPLLHRLLAHAGRYLEALGFDRAGVALHMQRCWPVVSEPGQLVGRHHHPNAHLSGVYYLNGDGSGRSGCLRLFPPSQPNELVPGLAVGHGGPIRVEQDPGAFWNAPCFDLAPRAGLLVLFPSQVDHAVLENQDPEECRFSISFDLALTAPATAGLAGLEPAEYLAPHPSEWQEIG
jgi:hypothetical protein